MVCSAGCQLVGRHEASVTKTPEMNSAAGKDRYPRDAPVVQRHAQPSFRGQLQRSEDDERTQTYQGEKDNFPICMFPTTLSRQRLIRVGLVTHSRQVTVSTLGQIKLKPATALNRGRTLDEKGPVLFQEHQGC